MTPGGRSKLPHLPELPKRREGQQTPQQLGIRDGSGWSPSPPIRILGGNSATWRRGGGGDSGDLVKRDSGDLVQAEETARCGDAEAEETAAISSSEDSGDLVQAEETARRGDAEAEETVAISSSGGDSGDGGWRSCSLIQLYNCVCVICTLYF